MCVLTSTMIGQGLNYPAVANFSVTASVHHPLQLGAQCDKLADTPVNFPQMSARDAVGLRARLFGVGAHRQQFSDGVDPKTQIARMTNEGKPGNFGLAIASLFAFAPGRRRH